MLLKLRKQFLGTPTRLDHAVAYGLAAFYIGLDCWSIGHGTAYMAQHPQARNPRNVITFVVAAFLVVLVLAVLALLLRRAPGRRVASEVALLGAYVSSVAFWLCSLSGERIIGWYVTGCVAGVFAADAVLLTLRALRPPTRSEGN